MNDLTTYTQIDAKQLGELRARRNDMRVYMVLSLLIAISSLLALIFNQQLIYRLFEISPTLQYLDIPATADVIRQQVGEQQDYFGHLLGWLFWLLLKPLVAFIGAFVVLHYAKRIRFIQRRMLSFGKKILAWLIAFLLLFSGLVWLQAEFRDSEDVREKYAAAVQYKQDISQSRMYFYLQRHQVAEPVADYLLAQTALLREPSDVNTAKLYMARLIQAEKQNTDLALQYDLDNKQLWAMQQQLYGKSVTASAKSVEGNIPYVTQITAYSRWLFIILLVIFVVFSVVFYGLYRQFNQRLRRIHQQLSKG